MKQPTHGNGMSRMPTEGHCHFLMRLCSFLTKHQAEQPAGYPYVFIPPARYDAIQKLRKKGKMDCIREVVSRSITLLGNFQLIREASRNCRKASSMIYDAPVLLTGSGTASKEYDVMTLAGHSSFETTRGFYLAVDGDGLLDRAGKASTESLKSKSVAESVAI